MSKPKRVVALLLAVLFLGTSIAFTVAVVLDMRKQDQSSNGLTQNETSELINQNQENKDMLQGTKLDGFTPVAQVAELQKIDIQEGTGTEVKPESTIEFHYTGALASSGTIFQSSYDTGQPATFPLSQLISGWQAGIPGMKAGGKRRLLIPAAQAYGPQEQEGIPANSDLVFDIEIVSIQ